MLTHTNPPLPPFPWLVQSEPAPSVACTASRKTERDRQILQLRARVAAAFAVLCGGTSLVLLWPSVQPAPATDLVGPAKAVVAAVAPAPAETGLVDDATQTATLPAIMREATPPAVMTQAVSPAPVPAPLIDSPATARPAVVPETGPVAAPAASPVADAPASAATIAEFRSVIEESRDTARQVIRLASRQRLPRDPSAEELTRYRLWQQNADAARGYRRYLDTLSRSMRSSPSRAVGQQLLEQAHQTRAYLTKMLADSQASLR